MAGWTASSNCHASWMMITHKRSHRRNKLTIFDSLEYFESWPRDESKTILIFDLPPPLDLPRNILKLDVLTLRLPLHSKSWPSTFPPGRVQYCTWFPPGEPSLSWYFGLPPPLDSPRTIFMSWLFTALICIFVIFFQYQGHFRSWRLQVVVQ